MKVVVLFSLLVLSAGVFAEEFFATSIVREVLQDEAIQNDPALSDDEKALYPSLEEDELEEILSHASKESLRDLADEMTTHRVHRVQDPKPLFLRKLKKKIKKAVKKVAKKVKKVVKKVKKVVKKGKKIAKKVKKVLKKGKKIIKKVKKAFKKGKKIVKKVKKGFKKVVKFVRKNGKIIRKIVKIIRTATAQCCRNGRCRGSRICRRRGDEPEVTEDEFYDPEELIDYDEEEE